MRVAIPAWDGRVSPVFDVAHEVDVFDVDVERGEVCRPERHRLSRGRQVATIADLEVDMLVCSAISPLTEAMLWTAGVDVVADVCGELDEIVRAVASGDRALDRFRVPGCGGRGQAKRAAGPIRGRGGSPRAG